MNTIKANKESNIKKLTQEKEALLSNKQAQRFLELSREIKKQQNASSQSTTKSKQCNHPLLVLTQPFTGHCILCHQSFDFIDKEEIKQLYNQKKLLARQNTYKNNITYTPSYPPQEVSDYYEEISLIREDYTKNYQEIFGKKPNYPSKVETEVFNHFVNSENIKQKTLKMPNN